MMIQEDAHVYERRRVLYGVIAAVFVLFLGRLYQLQMIYKDEYGRKSEENSIRTIPKEPVRGNMYDRSGKLVVDNRPAFTLTIMPFEFDKKNIPLLSSILEIDPAFLRDRLKRGEAFSRFQPVKILRDLSFKTLSAIEENRERLPGVDYDIESKRFYTTKAYASHILGYAKEISESQLKASNGDYVQGDIIGSSGLEAVYERTLRGKKGAEFSTVNVRGQVVGSFNKGKSDIPSVAGQDLRLTMDFGVQMLAESLMTGQRGSLVAVDPQTGGILAMVSKPDYDLNVFSGVVPADTWRDLNNNPDRPLYNRATLSRYPPGSTFKPLLALAALENGIVPPTWRIYCNGAFRFGNKVFHDLHVHGSVNMVEAIQHSCNVYFYQVMLKVGLDNWSSMGARFGFGRLTGIDIFEENPGLLPTTQFMNKRYGPRGWTRGFLPSLGIGQGEVGVTPLQMALYCAALANKGHYHQPHTVQAVIDKVNGREDTVAYTTRDIQIKPEHWDLVREGMRRAVMEAGGTGAAAKVKGIEVAGKTGTAQNPHGKDHAWFIGFAPFDNPRIAIAVLVENAGFGGAVAAPVAGMCMEQYFYGRLVRFDGQRPKAGGAIAQSQPAARTTGRN
jgi:penicillin-binding protein 2